MKYPKINSLRSNLLYGILLTTGLYVKYILVGSLILGVNVVYKLNILWCKYLWCLVFLLLSHKKLINIGLEPSCLMFIILGMVLHTWRTH